MEDQIGLVYKGGQVRVYIAGALSTKPAELKDNRTPSTVVTDYIKNIHKLCEAASAVRKLGHYPFIPGIDFIVGVVLGDWEEADYRDTSMAFLEVCDCMLVTSLSQGVKKEMERAKALNINIIYDLNWLKGRI